MRQKRAKAYRKLMHVYCMSFGFRQPYQVLLDSEMCQEAVASKIDLTKQLTNVLQGDVKPMITQCSIHSLYLSGRSAQPAVDLAKMFERRRCNHREAKPEEDCMRDVVGASNTHRYVLAAQSPSLRQHVRQVPGTPIVHVKRSVMVLEPASEASEKAKSAMEEGHMRPTQAESSAIASSLAPQKKDGTMDVVGPPKKKPKGPKGPNPLSVKKKKAKDDGRAAGVSRKGKERQQERKEVAGEKRKRDDFDEGGDGNDNVDLVGDERGVLGALPKEGEAVAVGRRRRRRRKLKVDGKDGAEGGEDGEGSEGGGIDAVKS